MSALPLAIATALVALRCQLISDDPYVLGSVSRVIPSTRPAYLRALNATRRLIGCPEVGDPQEPDGPFTGGQCSARYDITFSISEFSGQNGFGECVNPVTAPIQTSGIWGPIGGVSLRDSSTCINATAFTRAVLTCRGNGNAPTDAPVEVGIVAGAAITSASITSLSRIDNLPDDCGNPPGIYPPPSNFTTNIDITYNIDEGPDITVNIPFVFSPITANFDGTLRIPFTFDFGGFEFSGDIDLGPDFDVTINPPALPPGSGQGTDTLPPGDPEDEVEPLPLDQKVIGVVVNSSIVGEQQLTTIFTQGMPNILAPRAGSIKFAYSLGAATFWSSDIDVKTNRTFIPCPFSQGADAVVVSPAPGIVLSWVPIRGFPLATTNDVKPSTPLP